MNPAFQPDDSECKRRNWFAIRKVLGFYFAIGAAIALLIPESLAESLTLLSRLAIALGNWIPAIPRFSSVSPFPETMRLFMLAMWIGFPIAAIAIGRTWT